MKPFYLFYSKHGEYRVLGPNGFNIPCKYRIEAVEIAVVMNNKFLTLELLR